MVRNGGGRRLGCKVTQLPCDADPSVNVNGCAHVFALHFSSFATSVDFIFHLKVPGNCSGSLLPSSLLPRGWSLCSAAARARTRSRNPTPSSPAQTLRKHGFARSLV